MCNLEDIREGALDISDDSPNLPKEHQHYLPKKDLTCILELTNEDNSRENEFNLMNLQNPKPPSIELSLSERSILR